MGVNVTWLALSLPVLAAEADDPGFWDAIAGWVTIPRLLGVVVGLWVLSLIWYLCKTCWARGVIPLAPVKVTGGDVDAEGALEGLRAGLTQIKQTFQRMTPEYKLRRKYDTGGVLPRDREGRREEAVMYTSPLGPLPDSAILGDAEVEIAAGPVPVKVRLRLLYQLLIRLLCKVPVPWRKSYESLLIHVTIKFTEDGTARVQVWRKGKAVPPSEEPADDLGVLYRSVAFMILEARDKPFVGLRWKGVRSLADGLDAMYYYERNAQEEDFEKAQGCFAEATRLDPENAMALYFQGVTTWIERKPEAVLTAMKRFETAKRLLKSPRSRDERKLKALVHAGLAFCHAQLKHRHAGGPQEVKLAMEEAAAAREEWEQVQAKPDLMIRYAELMARSCDEGSVETRTEDRKRFLEAAKIGLEALEIDPKNPRLLNHLGWLFLKLTEWGDEPVTREDGVAQEFRGVPSETSERYFKRVLSDRQASPRTEKLTQANLCLLYATKRFRLSDDHKKYRRRCSDHGKKALKLDEGYVNGCRDLAFGLLRYSLHRGTGGPGAMNETDEKKAYDLFRQALRLCEDDIEKKAELSDHAEALLARLEMEGVEIDEKLRTRWTKRKSGEL
ncbi:MAG: hypothetical protein ACYTDY_09325 [Planctomycetota bacterium]|jgi:tetratricopeptide (TPR) repeat protein